MFKQLLLIASFFTFNYITAMNYAYEIYVPNTMEFETEFINLCNQQYYDKAKSFAQYTQLQSYKNNLFMIHGYAVVALQQKNYDVLLTMIDSGVIDCFTQHFDIIGSPLFLEIVLNQEDIWTSDELYTAISRLLYNNPSIMYELCTLDNQLVDKIFSYIFYDAQLTEWIINTCNLNVLQPINNTLPLAYAVNHGCLITTTLILDKMFEKSLNLSTDKKEALQIQCKKLYCHMIQTKNEFTSLFHSYLITIFGSQVNNWVAEELEKQKLEVVKQTDKAFAPKTDNPTHVNSLGRNLLHRAVIMGDVQQVANIIQQSPGFLKTLLLQKDDWEKTPYDYAQEKKNHDIISKLKPCMQLYNLIPKTPSQNISPHVASTTKKQNASKKVSPQKNNKKNKNKADTQPHYIILQRKTAQ